MRVQNQSSWKSAQNYETRAPKYNGWLTQFSEVKNKGSNRCARDYEPEELSFFGLVEKGLA